MNIVKRLWLQVPNQDDPDCILLYLSYQICVQNQWEHKILAEHSNTGYPSSFTVRMAYLFAFEFWYCEICVENRWGGGRGAESIVSLIFLLWRCFNSRWVRSCGLGQRVLFTASWNIIFFQPGFNPMQQAWLILACCINWMFLHFIFISHCCFKFSSLGNSETFRPSLV